VNYIGSSGDRCKIFRAGDNDNSPIYRHWEYGRYDAECPCCYLGFAHTEALHEQKTGEHGDWTPAICSADGFSIAINPYIER